MNLEDTYSLVVENKQRDIDFSRRGLKTLIGQNIPQRVEGNFYCYNNKLTSLEGAPVYVEDNFYCHNNKLTSLEGAPRYIGGYFYCNNNNLTSLEGLPEYVGGGVGCDDYLLKGENTYIIITSQIRGWYQGERDIDSIFWRIVSLFSK